VGGNTNSSPIPHCSWPGFPDIPWLMLCTLRARCWLPTFPTVGWGHGAVPRNLEPHSCQTDCPNMSYTWHGDQRPPCRQGRAGSPGAQGKHPADLSGLQLMQSTGGETHSLPRCHHSWWQWGSAQRWQRGVAQAHGSGERRRPTGTHCIRTWTEAAAGGTGKVALVALEFGFGCVEAVVSSCVCL